MHIISCNEGDTWTVFNGGALTSKYSDCFQNSFQQQNVQSPLEISAATLKINDVRFS